MWQLFRSHRESRFFQPVLETLESREALSSAAATAGAAIADVTVQFSALQASLTAGNYANANANLQTISNDFNVLKNVGWQLDTPSRIQVDNTMIGNGLGLVQMGANVFPQNPFFGYDMAILGADAVFVGYLDQQISSVYGSLSYAVL